MSDKAGILESPEFAALRLSFQELSIAEVALSKCALRSGYSLKHFSAKFRSSSHRFLVDDSSEYEHVVLVLDVQGVQGPSAWRNGSDS